MDVQGGILPCDNENIKNMEAHAPVWPKGKASVKRPQEKMEPPSIG